MKIKLIKLGFLFDEIEWMNWEMNEIFKSELRIDKESYIGLINIWYFLILRLIGLVIYGILIDI